ncbi:MAG TPA: type II secretion system F family protein [Gemmatimonadaceae bacterium]|nr:type II secretion system F family protein [Gemmatimonadaceae bacterium]
MTAQSNRDVRASLSAADLAAGLRILANLVSAGVPIARALRAFEDLAPPSWRHAIPSVRAHIKQGATLAHALESAPLAIPPLALGVVRAAEAGSGLAQGLSHAASLAESHAAVRAALRSALAYPIVVAIAGVGSIGVLVGVVLPRFSAVLADFAQQLPPITRFVLATAAFAQRAWLPVVLAVIAACVAWSAWTATGSGRRHWCESLLRLPIIGALRHAAATARFSLSLSALLKSGVPIAPAMSLAGRSAGDAAVEHRVNAARAHVASGAQLAHALENERAVTPAAARLIRAGEEAGSVTDMLSHASTLEQDRADRLTRTLIRLVEPTLLLAFAAIVGVIATAMLQAVYSIRPAT